MWDDYVPTLKRNHCVLSYDLFGHGDSDRPATEPTLKLFADQLKDLLDVARDRKVHDRGFFSWRNDQPGVRDESS